MKKVTLEKTNDPLANLFGDDDGENVDDILAGPSVRKKQATTATTAKVVVKKSIDDLFEEDNTPKANQKKKAADLFASSDTKKKTDLFGDMSDIDVSTATTAFEPTKPLFNDSKFDTSVVVGKKKVDVEKDPIRNKLPSVFPGKSVDSPTAGNSAIESVKEPVTNESNEQEDSTNRRFFKPQPPPPSHPPPSAESAKLKEVEREKAAQLEQQREIEKKKLEQEQQEKLKKQKEEEEAAKRKQLEQQQQQQQQQQQKKQEEEAAKPTKTALFDDDSTPLFGAKPSHEEEAETDEELDKLIHLDSKEKGSSNKGTLFDETASNVKEERGLDGLFVPKEAVDENSEKKDAQQTDSKLLAVDNKDLEVFEAGTTTQTKLTQEVGDLDDDLFNLTDKPQGEHIDESFDFSKYIEQNENSDLGGLFGKD